MTVWLSSPSHPLISIGSIRAWADFSERDRLLLNLLHPHLLQAYRNAEAVSQVEQRLAGLGQAVEESDQGIILLTPEGRIEWMTGQAQRWVEEYFGELPDAHSLPERLWRWVQEQHAFLAQNGKVPRMIYQVMVAVNSRSSLLRIFFPKPDPETRTQQALGETR